MDGALKDVLGPEVEKEDKQLDRYGRELAWDRGPFTVPNRAARRAAGIRTPLKVLNTYRDILESLDLEEGDGSNP